MLHIASPSDSLERVPFSRGHSLTPPRTCLLVPGCPPCPGAGNELSSSLRGHTHCCYVLLMTSRVQRCLSRYRHKPRTRRSCLHVSYCYCAVVRVCQACERFVIWLGILILEMALVRPPTALHRLPTLPFPCRLLNARQLIVASRLLLTYHPLLFADC